MKCPDCGQYSLTYDWERNGWIVDYVATLALSVIHSRKDK